MEWFIKVYDSDVMQEFCIETRNTEGEVPHALHHRYTYLPEASRPLFSGNQFFVIVVVHITQEVPRKIQPTVALVCLSLLHQLHTGGTCSLPTHQLQPVEILRFLSAHKILHPAGGVAVLLPVPVHFHIPDSVRSGSALPVSLTREYPVTQFEVHCCSSDSTLFDDMWCFFLQYRRFHVRSILRN